VRGAIHDAGDRTKAGKTEADCRALCLHGRLQPLIGLDDAGALERLRALRRDLIDPAIEEHGGTKAFVLKPEALTLLETGSRVASA
jgi:hypothetical protein